MLETLIGPTPDFLALLAAEDMPISDLGRSNQYFWKWISAGEVAGYIGLEVYGDAALLRSLVLFSEFRGKGYGVRLVEACVEQAKTLHISTLWLLTKTASPFFKKLGWQIVERRSAPVAIAQSAEFTELCPTSAICMKLEL